MMMQRDSNHEGNRQLFFSTDGGFRKFGVPPNGWFIMEDPIKMDDLDIPPFQETTKSVQPAAQVV